MATEWGRHCHLLSELSSSFVRIFLCRDVSSVEGRVCYIIEGSNQNLKMWSRFLELRDNGSLTIGSYIAVLNPYPVKNYFCNEIPIVECFGGCIVMKLQGTMASIDSKFYINIKCYINKFLLI